MCGIAGVVRDDIRDNLEAELTFALSCMRERGPDHEALWLREGAGLAHSRLSIIDLDSRSHQPFLVSEEIALTFNGEIYNFPELREELERQGHTFNTNSDTEVIAKGYLQWEEGVFKKLDGMFALGLLDLPKQRLFLARDRFGKKPLYVYQTPSEVFFSSDIRVLNSLKRNQLSINIQALDFYLTELTVPQPSTIWNEVTQVAPGAVRSINLVTKQSSEQPYWSLAHTGFSITNEEEALWAIEECLTRAILKRTLSDVPLGCFLSGGVDSGLVVSLLASNTTDAVRTFTISLQGHSMDESPLARRVAERYATEHTEVIVDVDLQKIAERMCDYCGEPFADSSIIPSFLVCQEISNHLRVALSGDGGDELFGGYRQYFLAYRTDGFLRKERRSSAWKGRVLVDKLLSRLSGRENLGSFERYAGLSGAQRMHRQMGFSPRIKNRLWRPSLRPSDDGEAWLEERWNSVASPWLSDQLMRASLSTRLLNDYLVKVDRSSMINSLEVRSPFLDSELADLAFSISPKLRFRDMSTKYLLKKLAQKHFAPDIFERAKTGFSIPVHEWISQDRMEFASDLILDKGAWIYRYFRPDEVAALWKEHLAEASHTHGLWALACLELWANSLKGLRA